MISFTHPVFLWSLAGLAVPVTIHLLSQARGKVIKVGSLRHLEAFTTSKFKSIHLNEILLLLLRSFMIVLVALFMSGLRCTSWESNLTEQWLLIEPEVEITSVLQNLVDSLKESGFEERLFENGFPQAGRHLDNSKIDYWSLISQLSSMPDHEVVVIASQRMSHFNGKRVPLPQNVRWIVVDNKAKHFVADAVSINQDSTRWRIGFSDSEQTSFQTRVLLNSEKPEEANLAGPQANTIRKPDTLYISIDSDPEFRRDRLFIEAALNVLSETTGQVVQSVGVSTSHPKAMHIWLKKEIPLTAETNWIIYHPIADKALFEKIGSSTWYLTQHIDEQSALRANLVLQLHSILFDNLQPINLPEYDQRTMPENMVWSSVPASIDRIEDTLEKETNAAGVLLILFLITWAAERWVSWRRNQ